MKYILAPDSFKGTMTSKEVIDIMKSVILKNENAEIVEIPITDGGEGFVDTIVDLLGGKIIPCIVHDPLMREVNSYFGFVGKTAFIEMALASGITLLKSSERNPMITSTFGTGELIKEALNNKAEKIIIGIGGSATNDGGMGMACALGIRFLDSSGNPLPPGGGYLDKIRTIDTSNVDRRIFSVDIEVLCDVNNVLTGPNGATYTYGRQKGASESELRILEKGMVNFRNIVRNQLKVDLETLEGSGAAGGLGGGLVAFLGGELKSGIDTILNLTDFEEHLKTADFVITGEGKLDGQSLQGKVIDGIIKAVKNTNCKLIVVAGYTALAEVEGVDFIISTTDRLLGEEALVKASRANLEKTMEIVINHIRTEGKNE